jgi:hypothetical protein
MSRAAVSNKASTSPSSFLPRIVYAIHDLRSSPTQPLGDAIETFIRREEAEHFVEEVHGDDPELAGYLRIEEREL